MSLASAIACIYFPTGIRQVPTDYFLQCFPATYREKGARVYAQTHTDTHTEKGVNLCMLFCNIFSEGMFFFEADNSI